VLVVRLPEPPAGNGVDQSILGSIIGEGRKWFDMIQLKFANRQD
jgi:hypothetical protein